MLSQEVYTFADDYRNAKREESRLQGLQYRGSSQNRTGAGRGSSEAIRTNRVDSSTKRAGKSYGSSRAGSSQAARSRKRSGSQSSSFSLYTLLKLLVPVLCIVLLLLVVKLAKPESRTKETEGPYCCGRPWKLRRHRRKRQKAAVRFTAPQMY